MELDAFSNLSVTNHIVSVASVGTLSTINVDNGTALSAVGLPTTVSVNLSNSTTSTTSAAVVWDGGTPAYDGNTAGTYTFSGTLSLGNDIYNPENKKATIDVVVRAFAIPTVTAVTPSSGPATGGTAVTIAGTNFFGVSAVNFGGASASTYTVNSSTEIIVISPAGSAGTVDITVVAVGGTSSSVPADFFTYIGVPTVASISPTSGTTSGGTSVTITGTNFFEVTELKFGTNNATYTVSSSTEIIAISPAGSAGTVDITVANPFGTSSTSSADRFTYASSGAWSSAGTDTSGGTDVIVNGETKSAGTTTSTTGTDGKTTTTVSVDTGKLAALLQSSGSGATVTIPFSGSSDAVEGVLTGQMVKTMEDGDATLVIKTDTASYTIPAAQIDISAISSQIGANVALSDIKVSVKISEPSPDTVSVVESASEKGSFEIVVPPVDFQISCNYNRQSIDISSFSAYVQRMIAIPAGVDPSKITTAAVLKSDGTVSHVPTQIVIVDSVYYAKVSSLTNSTYTIIWHPVEFADAAKHWAKDAINDMGSRMVVNGDENGNYNPDKNITRAEFSAIIVRALGLRPETGTSAFDDVGADKWYCGYIKTAAAYGIINGYDASTFGPNDQITREQAMTMLARAMKLTQLSPKLDGMTGELLGSYKDGSSISNYAKNSVEACLKAGVVTGTSTTTISPKDYVTRAEVAAMVQRLLQKSGLI